MKTWAYLEPEVMVQMTEAEILEAYYPWWAMQMLKVGKLLMATEQNCIEDWVVVHWAMEMKS